MKPSVFDYHRAASIDEAVSKLFEYGADAKVLAGGQSLIPMMKLRLARPTFIVDINRVEALNYVRFEEDCIAIGATRRQYMLESPDFAERCPLLRDALPYIGHEATRNRGTLCGSLAHADPTAESPVVACCLDAEMLVASASGTRTIAARDFFVSFFTPSLEADELLVEVRLPLLPSRTGHSFLEFSARHAKFGLVAVTLQRGPKGSIAQASIALGAVCERPIRADAAEAALVGEMGGRDVFRAAAVAAVSELDPPSDVHGNGEFRKKVAQSLVERALAEAWQRSNLPQSEAA
jgi:aerobic carbon-monoxide dehydrogenase medium subunit